MYIVTYLLGIIAFISASFSLNHTGTHTTGIVVPATVYMQDIPYRHSKITTFQNTKIEMQDTPGNDNAENSMDRILKKDINPEGAISNILDGLALCYNAFANLFLYPIFSFVLLALSLGALLLGYFWIKKIKNAKPISNAYIIFTSLYLIFYLDLFLIVFQKRQVVFLFLELEKDCALITISGLIGYIIGKFFSSKFYEEKVLP